MIFQPRLLVSILILCSVLVACNDADNNKAETTAVSVAAEVTSEVNIEVGMSEQAVADLLGKPSYTHTQSIDALTVTHSEWTDADGTKSVQFHNGKAQYNQFVANVSED